VDSPTASGTIASVLARLAESLAGEILLDRLLPQIVSAARDATGAPYAALGVLAEHTDLIIHFVHEGMDAATVARIGNTPTGGGLLGELIRHPHMIVSDDLNTHPAFRGFPEGHPPMTSFLGAPVRAGGRVFGNLYLTDKAGGFTQRDADAVTVLAAVAGLAVNAAQMAEELRVVAVQDERDRISRDLHDGVIQSLFSIGMSLEGARGLIRTDPTRLEARVDAAVDQLDATIKEIRTTIFTLRPGRAPEVALERGLVELAREYELNGAFTPSVAIGASLDQMVPSELVPDVLHVVREAFSNAARHAQAEVVHVGAEVHGDELHIEVRDQGGGFDPDRITPGHGLGNMAERAAVLGASLHIDAEPGVGTTVRLRVPLHVDD
jgi:signal transduction histidine kinase